MYGSTNFTWRCCGCHRTACGNCIGLEALDGTHTLHASCKAQSSKRVPKCFATCHILLAGWAQTYHVVHSSDSVPACPEPGATTPSPPLPLLDMP